MIAARAAKSKGVEKLGVYELMDVKAYAASILGRKTDIMTRDSLHKSLREAIEATAVRVFWS